MTTTTRTRRGAEEPLTGPGTARSPRSSGGARLRSHEGQRLEEHAAEAACPWRTTPRSRRRTSLAPCASAARSSASARRSSRWARSSQRAATSSRRTWRWSWPSCRTTCPRWPGTRCVCASIGAGRHRGGAVLGVRHHAARRRQHRAGAPRRPAGRHRGRGQGAAPGRHRDHGDRPRDPRGPGEARHGAHAVGQGLRRVGADAGVRRRAARGAGLHARGPLHGPLPRGLRRRRRRRLPRGVLGPLHEPCADDVLHRRGAGHQARGGRRRGCGPRAARPAGRRRVLQADLRPRLLSRRPARREPVRAARRAHRLRGLRAHLERLAP